MDGINYFGNLGCKRPVKWLSNVKENPTLAGLFASRVTGKHKKDVLLLLVGERGSGKSYTLLNIATRCAEEVAKRVGGQPEDYFSFDNVAVIQDDDLESKMRNLKKYGIYILDDAGIGWDSRAFATNTNRKLNHILQTCRTDNCILLISVIDPFTIDKVPRTMVRYYAEMAEQLHDFGMNLVKVFRNKRLFRAGKNLTTYIRIGDNRVAKRWVADAPPEILADEYDRVRDANAKKVRDQMDEGSCQRVVESKDEKKTSSLVVCNHCGYEWYTRVRNPKRCPACQKRIS